MDDPPKYPSQILDNHEPIKKNRPLKIKIKSSKAINGFCKEESHLKLKDQNSELKSYKGKFKNHLRSLSIDPGNRKDTQPANDESVHAGKLKIDRERTTCSVCGKIFHSMKSLFGHMRLHPDRPWRGIKPPPTLNPKNIASLTVSVSTMGKIDDQQQITPSTSGRSDFSLLQPLKGWAVTGKRGRISEELEAAEGLLMLEIGNSLDFGKMNNIDRNRITEGSLMKEFGYSVQVLESSEMQKWLRNEESELGKSEIQWKKHKVHHEYANSRDGFNPELVKLSPGFEFPNVFEEFSLNNSEVDQPGGTYRLYSISRNSIPFKSEIQMKKLCELGKMNFTDETPMSTNKHSCSICNKSFPSYQALGGHKSGHKNSIPNASMEEFPLVDIKSLTQADESPEFNFIMAKNVEIHQCKICGKTFSTGQALGGHQRSHRTSLPGAPISTVSPQEVINMESPISTVLPPEIINKDSPISSITSLEGSSNMMDKKLMELDLNELPPYDESF